MGARPQLHALTSLRFIAAALVLLGHVPLSDAARRLLPFMTHHTTAVGMFFALSGFVITYTYGERLVADPRGTGRYLWFRVARIYPAYVAGLVATLGTQLVANPSVGSLVHNVTMTQSWRPDRRIIFAWNPVSWSVSTESFFYLAFPLLAIVLLRHLRSPGAIAGVWVLAWVTLVAFTAWRVSVSGAVDYWFYAFPPIRFLEFTLGSMVGWLFVKRPRPLRGPAALLPVPVLVASLLAIQGQWEEPLLFATIFVPLFSWVVYHLASRGNAVRALTHPAMRWAGERSYSFFLLHPLGIWLGTRAAEATAFRAGSIPFGAVVATVAFAASLALAELGYTLVERPARARLRAMASRPLARTA